MVEWITRSTYSGGGESSGERGLASPAKQTPMRFEGARKSAVEAWEGIIGAGAGAGHGAGLARARRWACEGARGRVLASSEHVEHVARCFCLCSSLC